MAKAARFLLVALVVLASCSGGGSSASTTVPAASASAVPAAGTVPLVGEIYAAVKALQAKLGAPQQFFEINATSSLVNLIVALNDGAVGARMNLGRLHRDHGRTKGKPAGSVSVFETGINGEVLGRHAAGQKENASQDGPTEHKNSPAAQTDGGSQYFSVKT